MCDMVQDESCPVIYQSDKCSKEDIVSSNLNEEENKKDSNPEILGKSDSCTTVVSSQVLQKLADGFLSIYIDDIQKAASSLQELTKNQNIVIETLQQENVKFSEVLKLHHLTDMFSRIKHYNAKVLSIRKEMLAIHERTAKLKKRAMKLQQQKQKEALQKELLRDREIERDKQLAPKIATKPS
ncbi:biogenesis of lysosome-related organelles complex 1 subunit 6-like [Uloborus diversus]|uniref:biogenesis of lysosome-related organelles complex 1 subunit 6-like n=1 Tax=Uloborus diversus TaxID=327109 RepID=UPI00240A973D|nr:biogenesis of lysosome-related organelles complex 1 subunit 6-like [Uloborus diversus]